MIFATFTYRGKRIEILAVGPTLTLAITCPGCLTRYALNPARHIVTTDARGYVSVSRPILCRNPECGWHVRIQRGKAIDVIETPSPTSSSFRIPITAHA